MARPADGTRSWGRPEAADTLGGYPGRRRRIATAVLGLAAVTAGTVLGVLQLTGTAGTSPVGRSGSSPPGLGSAASSAAVPGSTCVSTGVNLPVGRFPVEGVEAERVVRLFRADRDGTARTLVARSFVLASSPAPDGSVNLSVLVRSGPGPDDRRIEEVNGANADRSLSVATLYDVDNVAVLDECRAPTPR